MRRGSVQLRRQIAMTSAMTSCLPGRQQPRCQLTSFHCPPLIRPPASFPTPLHLLLPSASIFLDRSSALRHIRPDGSSDEARLIYWFDLCCIDDEWREKLPVVHCGNKFICLICPTDLILGGTFLVAMSVRFVHQLTCGFVKIKCFALTLKNDSHRTQSCWRS